MSQGKTSIRCKPGYRVLHINIPNDLRELFEKQALHEGFTSLGQWFIVTAKKYINEKTVNPSSIQQAPKELV